MKETYRVDKQGRVLIPSNIRQRLNIQPDSMVTVESEKGCVCIRLTKESCALCGKNVEGKHHTKLTDGKLICFNCAQSVARAMMK